MLCKASCKTIFVVIILYLKHREISINLRYYVDMYICKNIKHGNAAHKIPGSMGKGREKYNAGWGTTRLQSHLQ